MTITLKGTVVKKMMVAKVCKMHTCLLIITMDGQKPAQLFIAQPINYSMTLNNEESLDQPLGFN